MCANVIGIYNVIYIPLFFCRANDDDDDDKVTDGIWRKKEREKTFTLRKSGEQVFVSGVSMAIYVMNEAL